MDFTHGLSYCPQLLKYVIIFCSVIRISAIEVRCGKPGRASIGRYTPESDSYLVGSTVRYSCEFPRIISKPDRRICQEDGTWSGIIPLCYDRAAVQQFLHSSTVQDKTPAKAVDSDPTTCFSTDWEKDGHWAAILSSPSTVTAVAVQLPQGESLDVEVTVKEEHSREVICNMLDSLNGQLTSGTFYCPENTRGLYVQVRDHSSNAHYFEICEVTIFTKPENPCLQPDVPYRGFGNLIVSGLEREYTYYCSHGYEILGAKKSFCKPSLTWSPKAPVCYRLHCMRPSSPDDGNVYFDEDEGVVPFYGTANYSCNPGLKLQGSRTRYCVGLNTWSGVEPLCVAKRCGHISTTVANGKVRINSTTVRSAAFLVCDDGYQPLSDNRIVCLPSGLWSHASLICAPAKRCGQITTTVANGKIWMNSTTVGSTAVLLCDDGYQPLSDNRMECLTSGLWSHASLICAPIRCDSNPTIPHGSFRLLANSTFYGSRLQVACDPGYVVRSNGLRMCEADGKWEDLSNVCIEIACDAVPVEAPERGIWHLLNDSFRSTERPVRVLTCHLGYHIAGTLPIVRCLENGSWSFTTATCIRTPEAIMSTEEWTPNVMLFSAIAVGAGTAICILCVVASFLGIRKRRHSRASTAVFHVGMSNHPTFTNTQKGISLSPEEHYYTSAMYEETLENSGYQLPKPRKPSAGLPLLPLDTDPVYAQPFETSSSMSAVDNKLRKGGFGSKEDPYSGHIYAEPIDSRRPPSGSSTVSGCIAEAWFRGGSTMKITRKMSLPDCQQTPKTGSSSSIQKTQGTIRASSNASLCLDGTEKRLSQELTGHFGALNSKTASNGSFGLFAELQSNSIYLRTSDQGVRRSPLSFGFNMADNDIYLDEHFSNA